MPEDHTRGMQAQGTGPARRSEAAERCIHWHLYIAGRPMCNPQSAQGPSMLQSASIRSPPC
eukprot:13552682-Alexandrium_andersonii.AAC.1